jgi:hypothetical protein
MLRLALAEFGFEEECTLGHDHGTGFQTIDNFDAAASALARNHGHCLKALGRFDEHHFAAFDGLHCFFRQRDQGTIASAARCDPDAQALTGCQATNALWRQNDGCGFAVRIEARRRRADDCRNGLATQQLYNRCIARSHTPCISGQHRRIDLYAAWIGNTEQFSSRRYIGAQRCIRFGYATRDQADHRQRAPVA